MSQAIKIFTFFYSIWSVHSQTSMALTKELWDWDSVGMWHPKLQQAGLPCSHPCTEENLTQKCLWDYETCLQAPERGSVLCLSRHNSKQQTANIILLIGKAFFVLKTDVVFVQDVFDAFKAPYIARL